MASGFRKKIGRVEKDMSLLSDAMEQCMFMDRTTQADGYGGILSVWSPGADFHAAITLDSSTEARRAEKEGVTNLYTITTKRNIVLKHGDVIKRMSDLKIFRVTSDGQDQHTPKSATLDMRQVSAEWLAELPK